MEKCVETLTKAEAEAAKSGNGLHEKFRDTDYIPSFGYTKLGFTNSVFADRR